MGIFLNGIIDTGSGTKISGVHYTKKEKPSDDYLYVDYIEDSTGERLILNIPKTFSENLIRCIDSNIGDTITAFLKN